MLSQCWRTANTSQEGWRQSNYDLHQNRFFFIYFFMCLSSYVSLLVSIFFARILLISLPKTAATIRRINSAEVGGVGVKHPCSARSRSPPRAPVCCRRTHAHTDPRTDVIWVSCALSGALQGTQNKSCCFCWYSNCTPTHFYTHSTCKFLLRNQKRELLSAAGFKMNK